jgi:cytochrome c-type biogenesis protein CcmF
MTEAAIDTGLFRDLYVSLGEPVGRGGWSVRVYSKPFVDWIWGGCVLMGLGGLLAISDKRYRIAARREKRAKQLADAKTAKATGSTASEAAS